MKKYIYILSVATGLLALASCQESVERDPGFELFDKNKPMITEVVTGTNIVDDRAVYLTVEGSSYKEEETAKAKEIGICWSKTETDPKLFVLTGGDNPTGYAKNFTSTEKTDEINKLLILGLSPKTKIYYRTYVLNAGGVSYGAVKEYTTKDYTTVEANLKSLELKTGKVVFNKTFQLAELNILNQFHAINMYGENNYIIKIDYKIKDGTVKIEKQKAYVNPDLSDISTDNVVSVQGTGSYDQESKTITLELEHSFTLKKGVSAKFPIYNETITW